MARSLLQIIECSAHFRWQLKVEKGAYTRNAFRNTEFSALAAVADVNTEPSGVSWFGEQAEVLPYQLTEAATLLPAQRVRYRVRVEAAARRRSEMRQEFPLRLDRLGRSGSTRLHHSPH